MSDLHVDFLGKRLAGPVIPASGTFGFGEEYADMYDLSVLGGICSKGLTLNGKYGNEGERLYETPAGLINSIGLQNPGVCHFIAEELPRMLTLGTAVFANLGGSCIEDYEEGAQLLSETAVDFIELNISCPNVKQGGIAYGIQPDSAKEVVSRVKAVCKKPLVVKLSPQAEDIARMAEACVEAGADALSLVNTFQACAIDIERRKPVFNNLFAGLSGPAVKPIALRMVYQVARAVKIPVIGMGGVSSARDVIEMMLAGATAVQVGAQNLVDPYICPKIIEALPGEMERLGIERLQDIIGGAWK